MSAANAVGESTSVGRENLKGGAMEDQIDVYISLFNSLSTIEAAAQVYWQPIKNCPGRYVVTKESRHLVATKSLAELFGMQDSSGEESSPLTLWNCSGAINTGDRVQQEGREAVVEEGPALAPVNSTRTLANVGAQGSSLLCFNSPVCKDPVHIFRFPGAQGGGLLSYEKQSDSGRYFVHTLNNRSGFQRKCRHLQVPLLTSND